MTVHDQPHGPERPLICLFVNESQRVGGTLRPRDLRLIANASFGQPGEGKTFVLDQFAEAFLAADESDQARPQTNKSRKKKP